MLKENILPINADQNKSSDFPPLPLGCFNATPHITCNSSSQKDIFLPPFSNPHDNREKINHRQLIVDLNIHMENLSPAHSLSSENAPLVPHLSRNEHSFDPQPTILSNPFTNITSSLVHKHVK